MTPLWRHNSCSSLMGTRESFTCWARVSYLWLKKKGGERGKVALDKKLNTLHLPFVYGHFDLLFACPYFILGPMLFFPSPILSFLVTGMTLSFNRWTSLLSPKVACMHYDVTIVSLWRGLSNKKAYAYYSLQDGDILLVQQEKKNINKQLYLCRDWQRKVCDCN